MQSRIKRDAKRRSRTERLGRSLTDLLPQYNLGVAYSNGNGVLQSYAEAIKWYRLAADQSLAVAQTNLGDMERAIRRQRSIRVPAVLRSSKIPSALQA